MAVIQNKNQWRARGHDGMEGDVHFFFKQSGAYIIKKGVMPPNTCKNVQAQQTVKRLTENLNIMEDALKHKTG